MKNNAEALKAAKALNHQIFEGRRIIVEVITTYIIRD
jgi:RNA recognition motif-containing protein